MSEELEWVELVAAALIADDAPGTIHTEQDWEYARIGGRLAVAALAEPLRQSQRVERLGSKSEELAGRVGLLRDENQRRDKRIEELEAIRSANYESFLTEGKRADKAEKRIEELEAALRREHQSLRAPHSRPLNGPCSVCALLDTKAKP